MTASAAQHDPVSIENLRNEMKKHRRTLAVEKRGSNAYNYAESRAVRLQYAIAALGNGSSREEVWKFLIA